MHKGYRLHQRYNHPEYWNKNDLGHTTEVLKNQHCPECKMRLKPIAHLNFVHKFKFPTAATPALTVFFGTVVIFVVLLKVLAPVVKGLGVDLWFLLK